jgi:hypothetical protein
MMNIACGVSKFQELISVLKFLVKVWKVRESKLIRLTKGEVVGEGTKSSSLVLTDISLLFSVECNCSIHA